MVAKRLIYFQHVRALINKSPENVKNYLIFSDTWVYKINKGGMGINIVFISYSFNNYVTMKDIGKIPAYLNKSNHNIKILTYIRDDNKNLDEIEGVKIVKIKNTFPLKSRNIVQPSLIAYILRNYKGIDCLILFGAHPNNLLSAIAFKVLRRNGLIYMKMDSDGQLYHGNFVVKTLKRLIGYPYFKVLSKTVDIISIESPEAMRRIKKVHPFFKDKLILLQNGVDHHKFDKIVSSIGNIQKEKVGTVCWQNRKGKRSRFINQSFFKVNK